MAQSVRQVLLLSALSFVAWLGLGSERTLAWQSTNEPVVKAVLPLLKPAGKAARVYYAATCEQDDPLWIPTLDIKQPKSGQTSVGAVRSMFEGNASVIVTQEPTGIIRIRIAEFSDEILQTRISHFSLTSEEQYNAPFVRDVLVNRDEGMISAINGLGLTPALFIYSYLVTRPAPGLPHMPPSMSDITADQVLDTLATSFNGIVLYGICVQSGLFVIDVVHQ